MTKSKDPLDKIVDWHVLRRGAIGIEVTAWCGFGFGKNLFHAYIRLGVFTIYATAEHLGRFLARWDAARAELRGMLGMKSGDQ